MTTSGSPASEKVRPLPSGLAGLALAFLLFACGGPDAGTGTADPARRTTGEPRTVAAAPGELPAGDPAPGTVPVGPVRADDVLLITIDTLRADALGFAGNARVATPALDRLASTGRVFDDAHAHNVVTLPSHVNILTGLHPFEHGVRDNSGFVLPASVPTVAARLGEAGFATGAFVGAFPLDARFGLDRGFETYDDRYREGSAYTDVNYPERRGDEVVAGGLSWWRENQGRRRFLWVHLFDPHAPYAAPEPFASRHRDEPYLGEVAAVDAFLAPLLDEVTDPTGGSTLVVFTSDHGEALGDHGELTHGLFAYESTLKVPLVLWAPGLTPGRVGAPARHVDLVPTILAAAGLEPASGLPGRSLLEVEATQADDPAIETYFESLSPTLDRGFAPLTGIIRERHKYVALPLPELYDLVADPSESANLVEGDRQRAASLRAALPAESIWPPERGAISAEERARLESLGYLGGTAPRRESYGPEDDPKRLVDLNHKVHQALNLYQEGRLREAEALTREVIGIRPQMGSTYYYLGQILLQQGRDEEAVEVMARAYSAGIASDALIRQLGLTLAQLGQAEQAVEPLRKLAAGGDPEALNAFGLVLSEAGRQEEAREVLEQVFEHDARNPSARENLALVALRRQDWAGAEDQARRALALNDRLALAWNYLGAALYNQGRPVEALDAWDQAVAWEPDNFDVLFNLGLVASETGYPERSRKALEAFLAGAPPERYGPDLERARSLLRQVGG